MNQFTYYSLINSYQIEEKLCENLINEISFINKEPNWLKSFRLNSFKMLKKMSFPKWGNFFLKKIFFENSCYYNFHDNKSNYSLKKTFNKIINKKKAIDFVYNSISVKTTMKKKLLEKGIIFCSLNESIKNFDFFVKKYLGSIVKPYDNFFSCLNSSIFSDGTFVYIPKNTICPIELSSYFRINDEVGQFERTLIICEENSSVSYLEGCTASKKKKFQLHTAVVELISKSNSIIKYSTVQNWYSGNKFNKKGIFNFVTKRGICYGLNSNIIWIQIETGSSITWKYPSTILKGNFCNSEFYSISISNKFQQIDTGTKVYYLGNNCNSYINSKSIVLNNSLQIYRGMIKNYIFAEYSKNYTSCDSIIINNGKIFTFPLNIILNSNCLIQHEANITKISLNEINLLKSKGIFDFQCYNILINNFCYNIIKKLPLEFFSEINDLLNSIVKYSIV
ncbi:FeS assembly protein SufB [Candidatus Carsonella ruddii HT isolate Thao2000]|uniref:FeS assembly protein SufB n=1 Tax=Candidatus Carsonella ruddii HT isolate Thao2000 TaxID=1202539 RepID=J3YQ96_CARRU|nr:Fe-S cluster assembly protein SufB [Candidatus Carsonella ruddii]AFP84078.1 FeS assembly protein SufB [Candidatus Carsonella ruddii HT isolate Thao2000]